MRLPGWAFWTLFAIAIPIHLVKRGHRGRPEAPAPMTSRKHETDQPEGGQ